MLRMEKYGARCLELHKTIKIFNDNQLALILFTSFVGSPEIGNGILMTQKIDEHFTKEKIPNAPMHNAYIEQLDSSVYNEKRCFFWNFG